MKFLLLGALLIGFTLCKSRIQDYSSLNSTSPNMASTNGPPFNISSLEEFPPLVPLPKGNTSSGAAPIPEPSEPKTHGFEDFFVKLNYERREYAKALDIANMYKLEWSDSLAEIAQKVSKKFTSKNKKPDRRFFFAGRNMDGILFENKVTNWIDTVSEKNKTRFDKWIEKADKWTIKTLEQYLPLQKIIGCAPWDIPFYNRGFGFRFKFQYSIFCLLGPEKSFKNSIRKMGPAGTECGDDGVEDGLCVRKTFDLGKRGDNILFHH